METEITKRKIKLNNGKEIPLIGFGTFQIRKISELEKALKSAIKYGYRLFDTSVTYGNEHLFSKIIPKLNIPREELIISTKIQKSDMTYEKTKQSINNSLKKMNLNKIDIVLIHWPEVENLNDRLMVWKALEECVEEGKIDTIGVSNFLKKHLQHILNNCKIKPAINQIEVHPLYYDKETIDFCQQNNIVVEGYCPLAGFDDKLIKNQVINNIAKEKNKKVPQIILKWSIQHNIIPLPKSVHDEYIKENIDLNDFFLTDEEMKHIDNLNIGYKRDWDPRKIIE